MNIVHIAAEFAPIAKVGGLGEVVVGLCRELGRLGQSVDVIIPKYDVIDLQKLPRLKLEIPDFKCAERGNLQANAMWSATVEGCQLHLLEARHASGYFHRKTIYGCEDDAARFLYFSRACLEYLKLRSSPIDVLHLHDWHTAIAAVLARDLFQLPIRTIILTIHNGEYQGLCAPWDLDAIGLDGVRYLSSDTLGDPRQIGAINLLKGGIVYADRINAVSPTYAKELLRPEMGFHLDPFYRKYKRKLSGILNGIDQKLWDPSADLALATPFSKESSFNAIEQAKEQAKKQIALRFGTGLKPRPWIGAITRIVSQKGPDLLIAALEETLALGGCFLLLGSVSEPKLREQFSHLKQKYAKNQNVLLHFEYDETISHQLYAALDFLTAPSLFEPCGLTQMIAMRYGAIPIVRATGGLKDTVFDFDDSKILAQQRNGFTFDAATSSAMVDTVRRAVSIFRNDKASFQSLVRRGMQCDFSWKQPARQYLELYRKQIQTTC